MIDLLGKLGIDGRLLIAQIINFGLLLWLLTKFLYRPIVARIEQDEAELKLAQTQKQALEKEKEAFEQQKREEVAEAKRRSKAIIKEAEDIAAAIKRKAQEEIDQEKKAVIDQIHSQADTQRLSRRRQDLQLMRTKIVNRLKSKLAASLPNDLQPDLQAVFFASLVKKLAAFSVNQPQGSKLPVVLESALPLNPDQKATLDRLLREKVGNELVLSEKQNQDLISGVRLELGGTIIESSLAAEIGRATDANEKL